MFNEKEKSAEITLGIHGGGEFEFPSDWPYYDDLSHWTIKNCGGMWNMHFPLDTLDYRFQLVWLTPYPNNHTNTTWLHFLRYNKDVYTAKIYFRKLEDLEG